jgi:hypothetical protein
VEKSKKKKKNIFPARPPLFPPGHPGFAECRGTRHSAKREKVKKFKIQIL